jgi:hypothetical protein
MDKFTIAGVSKRNGGYKVRFSSNQIYVKLLAKTGDTEITLVTLPNEMTKPEICQYLLTTDLMQNPAYKVTIEEAAEKYSGPKYSGEVVAKAVKPPKAAKVTKAPKDKAAKLADLQARAAEVTATTAEPVAE